MQESMQRIIQLGREHVFWALPLAVLAASIIWKDELFALFNTDAVNSYEARTEALLGTRPGPELIVRAADGSDAVSVSSLLGADSIVAVYRPGCAPCRTLVEHYVDRFGTGVARPDVKFLALDDTVAVPAGLEHGQFLYAEFAANDGFFDGRLTPTIWRFKDGVLVDRMIGLNLLWLDGWLDEMVPPRHGGRG